MTSYVCGLNQNKFQHFTATLEWLTIFGVDFPLYYFCVAFKWTWYAHFDHYLHSSACLSLDYCFFHLFFSLQFNDYFFHLCFVNQPPTIITREFYYTKCILSTKYWLLPMCYWYWYGMVWYTNLQAFLLWKCQC